MNGIVEIKGTYTSAITPAYLLVAFTSGKNDQGNGHLKTIDIIVDGITYFSIDLGTTNGIAAALMANHPTNATNHSLFAIKLPSKITTYPELKFDTYNKLSLNLDPTVTAARISDWHNDNASRTVVASGGDWPDPKMTHHQVLNNGDKSYQNTSHGDNRDAAQLFTTVISGDWSHAGHGNRGTATIPQEFGYKLPRVKRRLVR